MASSGGEAIPAVARSRPVYCALTALTIGPGLGLQWLRGGLPPVLADVLGDALWAMMIYWLLAVVRPSGSPWKRALFALLLCWAVEFSQLYHMPRLDAWRTTALGRLTLGSGFDPRDLLAYGLGILGSIGLESRFS